jgi:hypothetical protein
VPNKGPSAKTSSPTQNFPRALCQGPPSAKPLPRVFGHLPRAQTLGKEPESSSDLDRGRERELTQNRRSGIFGRRRQKIFHLAKLGNKFLLGHLTGCLCLVFFFCTACFYLFYRL